MPPIRSIDPMLLSFISFVTIAVVDVVDVVIDGGVEVDVNGAVSPSTLWGRLSRRGWSADEKLEEEVDDHFRRKNLKSFKSLLKTPPEMLLPPPPPLFLLPPPSGRMADDEDDGERFLPVSAPLPASSLIDERRVVESTLDCASRRRKSWKVAASE